MLYLPVFATHDELLTKFNEQTIHDLYIWGRIAVTIASYFLLRIFAYKPAERALAKKPLTPEIKNELDYASYITWATKKGYTLHFKKMTGNFQDVYKNDKN